MTEGEQNRVLLAVARQLAVWLEEDRTRAEQERKRAGELRREQRLSCVEQPEPQAKHETVPPSQEPPSPSEHNPILAYVEIHNLGGWSVVGVGDCTPQFFRVKNVQVDVENTANNVTARIEYRHASGDFFSLPEALWVVRRTSGKDISQSYAKRVFLAGNEEQSFVLFLADTGGPLVVSEDFQSPLRQLQVGKWTARVTVTADNCTPLEGEVGFTLLPGFRLHYDSPAFRPK
jgi:hypothetical protein